jgi:hypothetical protein
MTTNDRIDAAELEVHEIEAHLDSAAVPRFHGRQMFQWIHKRGVTDFDRMTDLAKPLREQLKARFTIGTPAVARVERSVDGTTKFLLTLADGRHIESVFIPDTPAQTFCLSTQVGCAMKCAFCLTAKMGIARNLTAGEIAGQVRVLLRELDMLGQTFNIVLMGMGGCSATSTDWRCRRAELRCPRSVSCLRSNVWQPNRTCRTWPSPCTRRPKISETRSFRSIASTASKIFSTPVAAFRSNVATELPSSM